MQLITRYFPDLSSEQQNRFSSLQSLYSEWNEKINVISRKDIDHLYERHVLHSLAIAKFISFKDREKVVDVGTGGGFPGLPLAILFPEVKFHLVDSIGKKIKVANAVIYSLHLKNVSTENNRAEKVKGKYDYVVSRAVAPLKMIYDWTKHLNPKGWICLKGGDLEGEIRELGKSVQQIPITNYFEEDFFKEKFIVHFK